MGRELCRPRERALAGLFHELLPTEEAEQRQVAIPQVELDPRGVWRVSAGPLVEVDHPRLAPLEVYAPAAPGCAYGGFVGYAGSPFLFAHGRSLPAVSESDLANFASNGVLRSSLRVGLPLDRRHGWLRGCYLIRVTV